MSWTKKYPFNRFNHLSTSSASSCPSNMGMSKLNCTLKGVVPREWLLDENGFPVGSRRRIWENLSIIMFIFRSRASLSNILKGSPTPSSYFSSTIGGHQGFRGWSWKGSTSSSPNSLYPNLVGYMKIKTEKEHTALIPLIQTYAGTQQNTDIHINTEMQQKWNFISLISKNWNMLTYKNGNKLARVMITYLWEEMWHLHASELC